LGFTWTVNLFVYSKLKVFSFSSLHDVPNRMADRGHVRLSQEEAKLQDLDGTVAFACPRRQQCQCRVGVGGHYLIHPAPWLAEISSLHDQTRALMMEVPILSGEQAGLNGGALIKASNNLKKNVVVESTDSIFTFPRTSSSFIFALQNS
jgi:hypothetical protein